jgi:hypothetical protein
LAEVRFTLTQLPQSLTTLHIQETDCEAGSGSVLKVGFADCLILSDLGLVLGVSLLGIPDD